MSYYGHKTFRGLFSIAKQLLTAGSHRFGGTHAQVAYKVSDGSAVTVTLHHSGVNVVVAEEDTVTVLLNGVNPNTAAVFANATFVDVNGSHTLAADTHGILLEGSLTSDGVTLDAESDIHLVQPGAEVSGTGKLLTFAFSQP